MVSFHGGLMFVDNFPHGEAAQIIDKALKDGWRISMKLSTVTVLGRDHVNIETLSPHSEKG